MLNELNGIVRDLLGLHGYPTTAATGRDGPPQEHRTRGPEDAVPTRRRLARKILVFSKVALGPSAMGHVHW